jgi:hypothetical protein
MKICYIISTCDKYLDNRVKFQMESAFLKDVSSDDIYYLTSKSNIDQRQFGWNCMDDPKNITWKYIHFIYNMDIPQYDWYLFIDDDTFVYKNRLQNMLTKYDVDDCHYIGKELDHITKDFGLYMSGGAGYAISRGLYKLIYEYVRTKGVNACFKHWCDDLCIGLWIQEIAKTTKINQLNSNLFNVDIHANDAQLTTDVTFHKVITKEQYDFYSSIKDEDLRQDLFIPGPIVNKGTVFTLITDRVYFYKAKRTIIDLRTRGTWSGEIVLITLGFSLNENFKDFYNVIETSFPSIDKTELLTKIGANGFTDTTDKREIHKLPQWEKLHVFDEYFSKWSRVVYLDAGLRVLDNVKYLLELDSTNRILAPRDGKLHQPNEFNCQLSNDNPELITNMRDEFGEHIFKSDYMLNCMWIYDTSILRLCDKAQLIEAMNTYTCCKTNEMGIMNILFHFKYNLWEPMPVKSSNNKFLFDWCELNQTHKTTWRDYCFMKYPVSISFDDT